MGVRGSRSSFTPVGANSPFAIVEKYVASARGTDTQFGRSGLSLGLARWVPVPLTVMCMKDARRAAARAENTRWPHFKCLLQVDAHIQSSTGCMSADAYRFLDRAQSHLSDASSVKGSRRWVVVEPPLTRRTDRSARANAPHFAACASEKCAVVLCIYATSCERGARHKSRMASSHVYIASEYEYLIRGAVDFRTSLRTLMRSSQPFWSRKGPIESEGSTFM